LGNPIRQQEWEINQDISNEEISYAISSTPNFKACDPDGIMMEFFKALIPGKKKKKKNKVHINKNINTLDKIKIFYFLLNW